MTNHTDKRNALMHPSTILLIDWFAVRVTVQDDITVQCYSTKTLSAWKRILEKRR